MFFWILFLAFLLLSSIGCAFYLSGRLRRFRLLQRVPRWGCLAAVLLLSAAAWVTLGYMNAIIILIHLTVFWLLADLVQRLAEKAGKKPARRYYAGAVALLVTAVYLGVGCYQAYHVWQTDYTVVTNKNVGNLRVALIADSHVGTTFSGEGLSKHVRTIQAQQPDVVVVAGDFVDEDTIAACRALGEFDVPYGVYFAFGNHDKGNYSSGRGYGGDELIAELEKNGITVLQDEQVLLDGRFCLIGRQDASDEMFSGIPRATMAELTEHADEDKFTIVLDHQPRDYEAQATSGVDLVLSGHTHGGQLIPLMQFIRWFHAGGDDRVYGAECRENTNFIVTSGISDWAIKFKTGCFSEFVLVDIVGQ